jgi:hypothetical protein
MAATGTVQKIDSNVTGLRFQEELAGCIGVADSNNPWLVLEPNSYDDFGGEFTTVARNPINAGRQRQKGVLVDLDASGGFQSDVTQENLQEILQGFFFADLRRKADVGAGRSNRRGGIQGEFADYTITDIDTTADTITVDSRVALSAAVVVGGTGYAVGDVVEVTDVNATIEARFIVTGETAGVVDTVALTLAGFTGGLEGRTHTDTGVGAATTVVTGSGSGTLTLTVTYGDGLEWQENDILHMQGNTDAANNGLFTVAAGHAGSNVISVDQNLVTDAAPAATATMTTVGFEGAAGDLDIDASGALPQLTTAAEDFQTMGLIPGEWIFIGGDLAAEAFTNVDTDGNEVNNGWARIHTVATGALTFDKTSFPMTTEASTTETIRIWFGRVLKNESDPTLQVRRTYQLERQLGTPDADFPAQIQAEYLEGWVPNEMTLNYATADKITADLSGIATNVSTIDGPTALKAGARPSLVSGDAFNTSNDISRLKLAVLDRTAGSAPTALFAFLTEFSVTINNNLSPNKAISVLGAFDVTAGQFNVEGSMEAYFADVTAVTSIRNNDDVTFDVAQVKGATGAKAGMLIDVPLITLGDGRLEVTQDEPITLPLDIPAGADRVFDHTLLMMFWDYLPDRADT